MVSSGSTRTPDESALLVVVTSPQPSAEELVWRISWTRAFPTLQLATIHDDDDDEACWQYKLSFSYLWNDAYDHLHLGQFRSKDDLHHQRTTTTMMATIPAAGRTVWVMEKLPKKLSLKYCTSLRKKHRHHPHAVATSKPSLTWEAGRVG